MLIGEKFIGNNSNAKGIYVSKQDDSTINYLALNDFTFQNNETVTFEDSSIEGSPSEDTLARNCD